MGIRSAAQRAAFALACAAVVLWLGSQFVFEGDYLVESWPAYFALRTDGVETFLRLTPAYAGFVTLIGAPISLLERRAGHDLPPAGAPRTACSDRPRALTAHDRPQERAAGDRAHRRLARRLHRADRRPPRGRTRRGRRDRRRARRRQKPGDDSGAAAERRDHRQADRGAGAARPPRSRSRRPSCASS